jgi:hypothetical protein
VQLWNKKDVQPSIIDPVLKEIDELCLTFQDFPFSYVSRVCNKVAHTLAKQVPGSHRSETWHVTPTCVYDLIVMRLRLADNERQASHKKAICLSSFQRLTSRKFFALSCKLCIFSNFFNFVVLVYPSHFQSMHSVHF